LLLLMDANKKGKVSKQESMKFMDAKFELLDKDKNGVLSVCFSQELASIGWRFAGIFMFAIGIDINALA